MKNTIFCIFILLISCKETSKNGSEEKIDFHLNNKKEIKNLTYKQFKGTKWVIGEVGVNGEKPDTLVFSNPKTLTYISTDNGEEICKYSFLKDTLVYTSYSTEFDVQIGEEITCEIISKLHFQNDTFKYINCYLKKSTEKEFRCANLEKDNLLLRKI